MNSNIEKILSISAGVLLAAIAFAFFFSSYNRYLDYMNSAKKVFEEDIMVGITEGKQECRITGNEVIHMIIEANSKKEIMKIRNLYASGAASAFENSPEIWINGMNAELAEISAIDPASYYDVRYEVDFRGNIIRIDYSSK